MLTVSGSSNSSTVNLAKINNISSGINSEQQKIGTRYEAIDHIKTLTHDKYGELFEVENTIGSLNGKTEVPLRSIELASGEKQYFATAKMDPRKYFYIEDSFDNQWNMKDLSITDYNIRHVVFIFGSEFSSNTFPIGMNLSTEKTEEIDDIYYVHCHQTIKFALHESRLDENEIKQKSKLINSIINEKKPELIQLLKNCTSRNINCSSKDAVKLCEEFPKIFDSTGTVTPNMQINAHKLVNELEKNG